MTSAKGKGLCVCVSKMNSMKANRLALFCLLGLIGLQFSDAQHWSYEHGDEWPRDFPVCGSETQSPIDFIPESIVYDKNIPDFQFHDYDDALNFTEFNLTNNGHSVQMNIVDNSNGSSRGTPFVVSGGGLPSNFTLAQFHLHWGRTNGEGSEHTVENTSYPMELHLVHWDSIKFNSSGVAANQSEGLAVLGVFVQIGEKNNSVFDRLITNFNQIKFKDGTPAQVPPFPLIELLPTDTKAFYRYRGSLTTPPCYNSVIWTVFLHPITISELQLLEFRTRLYEESVNESERTILNHNFRETQSIHTRTVSKTFDNVAWSYRGTSDGSSNWKNVFPKCGGEFQSPIDITTSSVVVKEDIPPVTFTNYDSVPSGTTFTIRNTGNSVELLIGGEKALNISGGGLGGDYVLEKVTLHWGTNNAQGSEHRLNTFSYPLEIQYLHYSSKYSSSSQASMYPGGLAILAVFFQGSPENNTYLNPILNHLQHVRDAGNSTVVNTFPLRDLIPTEDMSFYRYNGSLSVPNCAETATWIVFAEPLKVSAQQMEIIRTTLSFAADGVTKTPLTDNFRPTQPLNSRTVTKSVHRHREVTVTSAAGRSSSVLGCWLFAAAICLASYMNGM